MDTITANKNIYTFIFLMTVMFDDFQPSYFTTLQLLDSTLNKRETMLEQIWFGLGSSEDFLGTEQNRQNIEL